MVAEMQEEWEGPACVLMMYQCTRTHSPHPPLWHFSLILVWPAYACIPVNPHTPAASSSLALHSFSCVCARCVTVYRGSSLI
jgi:hypothetical protein